MDIDQSRLEAQGAPLAVGATATVQSPGNCSIEQLPAAAGEGAGSGSTGVQGYVIKVPGRPAGTARKNPCRALDVTLTLTDGQTVWIPG